MALKERGRRWDAWSRWPAAARVLWLFPPMGAICCLCLWMGVRPVWRHCQSMGESSSSRRAG